MNYAGSDWIARSLKMEMSPLGVKAADFLGELYRGIYHLNRTSLQKANWDCPHHVRMVLYGDMSTYDFNDLTTMVVLSHDMMLRVNLRGIAPGYMEMLIHERTTRDMDAFQSERLPELDDHIATIRKHYR